MNIQWWLAWRDPVFLSLLVPEELIVLVRDKHRLWIRSIVGVDPWPLAALCKYLVGLGLLTLWVIYCSNGYSQRAKRG